MKKNILLTLVATFSLVSSFNSQAADSSMLEFLGISSDGKYAAFEQFGSQDGSGFTYSEITFLNVDQNIYAAPTVRSIDEEPNYDIEHGLKRPRDATQKKASPLFRKFGIKNLAQIDTAKLRKVVARSPWQAPAEIKEVSFLNRGIFWEQDFGINRITLKLSPLELPCPNQDGFCGSIGDSQDKALGLQLDLDSQSDREEIYNYHKTLQSDKVVPRSRSNATQYSISDVYLYDPSVSDLDSAVNVDRAKIISVIAVSSFGFEGQNLSYMFVTGALK